MNTLIAAENVSRVYSGKIGCACGCKGKYYEAGSPMVKKVVRLINENGGKLEKDSQWAEVEIGERVYVAYLGAI